MARLVETVSPILDGEAEQLGDGVVRARALRIGVGAYATPFWIRTAAGLLVRVDSLPWQGVIPAGSIEVRSNELPPVTVSKLTHAEHLAAIVNSRAVTAEQVARVLRAIGVPAEHETSGPPPSGWRANEPSGWTTLTDNAFTSIPGSGWAGPFEFAGEWTAESGSTTPRGTDTFARMTFPEGWVSEMEADVIAYDFSPWTSEIYVCCAIRIAENFQWGTGNKNGFRIYDESVGQLSGSAILGGFDNGEWIGGTFKWRTGVQRMGGDSDFLNPNLSQMLVSCGDWVQLEVRMKHMSAPDTPDGEFHMWVNETKTTQYTNVVWNVDEGDQTFSAFVIGHNRAPFNPDPTEEEDSIDWGGVYISKPAA